MTNVTMKTNQGTVELELFDADAPKTVENFVKLAGTAFTTASSSIASSRTS